MRKTYSLKEIEIPMEIAELNGPFQEFKQDVSIVSVKLNSGEIFERVMLLYPNYVISVAEESELPFNQKEVSEVLQSPQSLRRHKDSSWVYWYNQNDFSKNT